MSKKKAGKACEEAPCRMGNATWCNYPGYILSEITEQRRHIHETLFYSNKFLA